MTRKIMSKSVVEQGGMRKLSVEDVQGEREVKGKRDVGEKGGDVESKESWRTKVH